jgi:hypothetical protein
MKKTRTKLKEPQKYCLNINGQSIPWSFVYKIHTLCSKDWDATIDCFWKAKHCIGANGIQRYIMCGFKPDKFGNKFMLRLSKERENGQMESLRNWWMKLYVRKRTADAAQSASLSDMMAMLAGKFSLPKSKRN